MHANGIALSALAIGLVLFVAVNLLSSAGLRGARVDLTEEGLYTFSEGARNIARELPEPVNLYLYLSEDAIQESPGLATYSRRVREYLEEFERVAGGNVRLEVVDPEPYSEAEDRAVQAGLYGMPLPSGSGRLYFGLVGTSTTDDQEVISFFDPRNERFLEHDVARLVYSLAHPEQKTVGVISTLPMFGGRPANPFQQSQAQQPWQVVSEVRRLFEVRDLGTDVTEIPEDVDVLWIVHPKDLSDATTYAVDQFVLGGGRALVFVDPRSVEDQPPPNPQNPMASMTAPRDSDMPRLLKAWGLGMVPQRVAGDRSSCMEVAAGEQGRPRRVRYLPYLELRDELLNSDEFVTSELSNVILAAAGVLEAKEDATTEITPLFQTSTDSMRIDASMLTMPDPESLLATFVPEDRQQTLAVRVSGPAKSAFPDGPPDSGGADPEEGDGETDGADGEESGGTDAEAADEHLAESTEPIQAIVVADADMLSDRFWIEPVSMGGMVLGYNKWAANGDFVQNALDTLTGSDDLIGIRGRGRSQRPFEKLEDIRREAEEAYLAEERRLQEELRSTEQRLADLQREKQQGDGEVILTPEQLAEVEQFREKQIEIRKNLREVQHELIKDVDALKTKLKVINIASVPSLVVLAAFGAHFSRRYRRRSQP